MLLFLSCSFHYVSSFYYHSYDYYSSGDIFSGTLSLLLMVTMALSLMGLPATSGQHDVVLPALLTLRYSKSVVGLATVPQQKPPSQMPLQAYANYALGAPQVGFSFKVEPSTILYFIYLVYILVSAFCFQVPCWMQYSPMGAKLLGFEPLLCSLSVAGICATW